MGKMASDGTIRSMVIKATEDVVAKAVKDVIGGHKFERQLEAAMEEAFKVDLGQLGIDGYNALVMQVIKNKLSAFLAKSGAGMIEKEMEDLLTSHPAEIKASELFEKFCEQCAEDIEERESSECTIIVDQNRAYGRFDIYLDKGEGVGWSCCQYSLRCHKDGAVWAVKVDGDDPRKTLFLGPTYNFDRLVFHAYSAKMRIILDETCPSAYYHRVG